MNQNKQSFEDVYAALLHMVKEIESEQTPLNDLADKVKKARSLLSQCESQLRDVTNELDTNNSAEDLQ